jgi:hypothetical protein
MRRRSQNGIWRETVPSLVRELEYYYFCPTDAEKHLENVTAWAAVYELGANALIERRALPLKTQQRLSKLDEIAK